MRVDGACRGPPVSGVAMSTQSISSASEAALFGAGNTSVNIARYAEKGTTRAPRARGRREIRRATIVVDVETERREMSGRLELTCRARCRRRRRSRRHGPSLGGRGERRRHRVLRHRRRAHRVVRFAESTVNPHLLFVWWRFVLAFSVGRHSILVGVLFMDETGEMLRKTTVFQNQALK